MKKVCFIILFLTSFCGFSQTEEEARKELEELFANCKNTNPNDILPFYVDRKLGLMNKKTMQTLVKPIHTSIYIESFSPIRGKVIYSAFDEHYYTFSVDKNWKISTKEEINYSCVLHSPPYKKPKYEFVPSDKLSKGFQIKNRTIFFAKEYDSCNYFRDNDVFKYKGKFYLIVRKKVEDGHLYAIIDQQGNIPEHFNYKHSWIDINKYASNENDVWFKVQDSAMSEDRAIGFINMSGEERLKNQVLHNNKKPIFFFFQKLFNTENYKKWNNEISEILSEFDSISSEIKQLNSQIEKKSSELNIVENQLKSFQNQLNQIERFEKEYENLKSQLTQDYKIEEKNLFDEKFYGKDLKEIHLLSPYHSEFIAKLRSEIFLNALEVHKYTILNNAKQFKNNLNSFFEMITGRAKIDEELIQSLWDTFFFCVPVVSTSLASASKLFPNMAKNQIGWLLIDEAGQATPQSVAGLIQRSKRCVIVGDPIQVEPVVTIPKTLVDGLIKHQNIDSVWSPYNGSAQQLADRISKYGTQMGDVWTGFPLRTHRRCFNPMSI
ncbi:AAA domain-containing protein [Capnocytophaga stomatis]|uniref:AAA domain-containing protein n=1 Tax=Capnocytophaga stomatis TaxID=1848904 RepID=UPI0012FF793F|nr:AAA domain-containing protein [Capnocytophaga stomatis]